MLISPSRGHNTFLTSGFHILFRPRRFATIGLTTHFEYRIENEIMLLGWIADGGDLDRCLG
jgi:hypothetical protein